VSPGVIVDYNRRNAVVGVEVLYLSKRTPKSGARKHSAPDATAALVLHDKPPKKSGA